MFLLFQDFHRFSGSELRLQMKYEKRVRDECCVPSLSIGRERLFPDRILDGRNGEPEVLLVDCREGLLPDLKLGVYLVKRDVADPASRPFKSVKVPDRPLIDFDGRHPDWLVFGFQMIEPLAAPARGRFPRRRLLRPRRWG